jgi:hypothetical protein
MAERGSISGMVGDIPIVNTSYSGDLTKMSKEELQTKLRHLVAAGLEDDDECDEAFENRQTEISAVRKEIKSRTESE